MHAAAWVLAGGGLIRLTLARLPNYSIKLLDPTDSGVISMVDFYDTFQRKQKPPTRRRREDTPTIAMQVLVVGSVGGLV